MDNEFFRQALGILLPASILLTIAVGIFFIWKTTRSPSEDVKLKINFLMMAMFALMMTNSAVNQEYGTATLFFFLNVLMYRELYKRVMQKTRVSESPPDLSLRNP